MDSSATIVIGRLAAGPTPPQAPTRSFRLPPESADRTIQASRKG